MSVYLRGKGKNYNYEFVLDGNRYRGSTKQKKKKDALIFENAEKDKARKGLLGDDRVTILLKDAYETFLKVPRRKSPGAQREIDYRSKYNDFVLFMTDKYPEITEMNQVTNDHAEEYIYLLRKNGRHSRTVWVTSRDKVIARGNTPKHMATSTINDYIMLLKMIFKYLKKKANIQEDPFADIPQLEKDTEGREAFTIEELKLIGEKSRDIYLYPLFLTGICTGMREGDICLLKSKEINLNTNWIDRKTLKTGKQVTIPIMSALRAYLSMLSLKGKYAFPELAKQYTARSTKIGADVTKFLESIGIESIREVPGRSRRVSVRDIHSLRHTFAYMSALAGIPLPVVQSVLGHMDSKMTQDYMNHASAGAKQKYLAALPDYLNTGHGTEAVTNDYLIEQLKNMDSKNWQDIRKTLINCIETQVIQ